MNISSKTIKVVLISLAIIVVSYLGYHKVSAFFAVDACLDKGGSWNDAKQECEFDEQNYDSTKSDKVKIALAFINSYLENINKLDKNFNLIEWVDTNGLVNHKFRRELKRVIEEANQRDPEYGLGFDPILDAQDSPTKFELEYLDDKTNYMIFRGVDWYEFRITMKVVEENGKWLVDGSGIINIPIGKRSPR